MNKIKLAPNIIRIDIRAPHIAKKRKAGQFVLIMADEKSERAPFTIMDSDFDAGIISIVVQIVGTTTHKLNNIKVGDKLHAVVGPLGKPTHIDNFGNVVCIGGGVGTAVVYPITCALKKAGNNIYSIIGSRNKEFFILEHEMKSVSDNFFAVTDDGSLGQKGFVTNVLLELIEKKTKIDMVLAIGPAIMMKAVSEITKKYNIKTIVSLNSIMIDGTGMCGSCRVLVGGKTKFVCTDGPEFDGHKVDFDNLMNRQKAFVKHEKCSLDKYLGIGECSIEDIKNKV